MRNKMVGAQILVYTLLIATFGGLAAVCIFFDLSTAVGMISGIISIATFLIYVVGRMWLISHGRTAFRDKIYAMDYDTDDLSHVPADLYVVDEIDCRHDGCGDSYMVTSVDGIYDLRVNYLEYDDGLNEIVGRKQACETITFVNPGHSVSIRAFTPDVIAVYEVEFYTYDYKRVRADLFTSGRNGSFAGGISVEAGWRSFWYQFLNG